MEGRLQLFKLRQLKLHNLNSLKKSSKGHNSKSNTYLKIEKINVYFLLLYTSHFLYLKKF